MGANLLRREAFACHVPDAEVDELLHALVDVLPIGIAPLAVVLIQLAVGLPADEGVLQGHPAALTHQLPGGAQKGVDGHIKEPGQLLQRVRAGHRLPVFPAGNRCCPQAGPLHDGFVVPNSYLSHCFESNISQSNPKIGLLQDRRNAFNHICITFL